MKPKKNPDMEVGRNSSLYFAVGLNIMLLFTWMLFEHKTYDHVDVAQLSLNLDKEIQEEIPITEQLQTPPPPPPPPAAAPETIQVIEDVTEIEESTFMSTEVGQDDVIADRDIVQVEEIEVEEVEEDIEVPFAAVERVPVFPGCTGNNDELKRCFEEKIMEHVKDNFKFPESAIESNQQGKVFVMFTIDTNGKVGKMRTRGPYKILENEARRIIGSLPEMEPAKQRHRAVKVSYSMPISFKILEQ